MKQVIVVNTSLNMPVGKLAAQVAHASQFSWFAACCPFDDEVEWAPHDGWESNAFTKIVLAAKDHHALNDMAVMCDDLGLPHFLVRDAGRTVLEPGTITALGIGPADIATIDRVTGGLKLL